MLIKVTNQPPVSGRKCLICQSIIWPPKLLPKHLKLHLTRQKQDQQALKQLEKQLKQISLKKDILNRNINAKYGTKEYNSQYYYAVTLPKRRLLKEQQTAGYQVQQLVDKRLEKIRKDQ